ncbi:MAG: hypothetical protein ACE5JS_15725 [Nitrospinota bacterium]
MPRFEEASKGAGAESTSLAAIGVADPKLKAFAQRLTELLRKLDDGLAGAEKTRLRRSAREAGLRPSERGISACRRWPWWGWWLLDSAFCAVWLAVWFDFPRTPSMSLWLVLLAGGLPWAVVAAMATGVGVIALVAYLPWTLWNWWERKLQGSPGKAE